MSIKPNYNYGKCHICGEQMKEERISQDFWIKGKLIVIEKIPAGVCPQCGEKTVSGDVGRVLASLLHNPKRLPRRRTIGVPVYALPGKILFFNSSRSQSRREAIDSIPVDSRMIVAVRYEKESKDMDVIFRTGQRYRYKNVPLTKYRALLKAESKGKYMHKNILDRYAYELIR